MRKPTWWDLGIAMLGLVLVCGAAQGVAQAPDAEDSVEDVTQDSRITGTSDGLGSDRGLATDTGQAAGTGGAGTDTGQATGTGGTGTDTGQMPGTQQLSEVDAQQRLEIARLRTEVARLEQQLAQMRARLDQAESTTQGVGGSGSVGIGDPNAEAPDGASGVGYPTAEVPAGTQGGDVAGAGVGGGGSAGIAPDTSNQGIAEASVIHTGRVRSVSQQRLVLDEEGGGTSTLSLARDVRVIRNGQPVTLRSLAEGTLVRTSANLYARGNPVTRIEVLPPP